MKSKIGFCCKLSEQHPTKGVVSVPEYNVKTTTMRWLRENKSAAEKRQLELVEHNLQAVQNLVTYVSKLPEHLRMVRLGSDILLGYTESSWQSWWKQQDMQNYLEKKFSVIGAIAQENNVRLSFHPGQFCVLASDRPEVVQSSIDEVEYHADMARWMGYGKKLQDFKINVHISGRKGPAGIREVFPNLSTEARNMLTIENEENSWGLSDCLELADIVPIVLDIHHCWINEGIYIQPSDDRVKRVIDSWRDSVNRPVIHYSVSREGVLEGHAVDKLPDMNKLIASGFKKQHLRAHSDYYWNSAVNEWAASFTKDFDIQCESKAKNLARDQFAQFITD